MKSTLAAVKRQRFPSQASRRVRGLFILSLGGRHSSVVSSAPTILRPRVQVPSTPSMLFSILIIEIALRK